MGSWNIVCAFSAFAFSTKPRHHKAMPPSPSWFLPVPGVQLHSPAIQERNRRKWLKECPFSMHFMIHDAKCWNSDVHWTQLHLTSNTRNMNLYKINYEYMKTYVMFRMKRRENPNHDDKDVFHDDQDKRGIHIQTEVCLAVIQKYMRNQTKRLQ